MSKIKLSILCITYNHEKFIRDTLDGFIAQKTDFEYEVLIHDDASTDNTANIIREYQEKYPNLIKPIFQTENQFSKGESISKKFNFPRIAGEYVAMCEGDDYWIDTLKLQKQVNFLDANQDVYLCFHPVKEIYEDHSVEPNVFPSDYKVLNRQTLGLAELLKYNFISTSSVMYRWILKDNESLFPSGIIPGDWFLHLLHAQKGRIHCHLDIMSVYRRHQGGIWWERDKSNKFYIDHGIRLIAFYQAVEKQFNCDKQKEIILFTYETLIAFLQHCRFEKIEEFSQRYPILYERFIASGYDKSKIKALQYKKKYNKYKKLVILSCVIYIFTFILLFLR
ncbi:glycosyltransferase [Utexia brackfieldae]|uniref:glycosyltransferase n=1 Tax=Utexia brackfieldae TaxID=3074108 RepID=UPI00370D253F